MNTKRQIIRKINIAQLKTSQWQLHQQLGKYATDLDRLKDLAEVRADKQRSAPVQFLELIF